MHLLDPDNSFPDWQTWMKPGLGSQDASYLCGTWDQYGGVTWLYHKKREQRRNMKLFKLRQGTDDWLAWRQKGLGASDAGSIVLDGPWTTRKELWEQKRGLAPPVQETFAMKRGKVLEPQARRLYRDLVGIPIKPVCAVHDTIHWLKASLDGWCPVSKVVVEIKAPNRDTHQEALDGLVPEKYRPQCLHQLLVTEAPTLHYVSYSPQSFSPPHTLAVVEIRRGQGWADQEALDLLLEAETHFWSCVDKGIEPW